jgi:hypothetical protein
VTPLHCDDDVVIPVPDHLQSRWGLVEHVKSLPPPLTANGRARSPSPTFSRAESEIDNSAIDENLVLSLIHTTTSAIRSVQKYFISLPPDRLPPSSRSSQQLRRTSNPAEGGGSSPHHHLAISTSARPRASLGAVSPSPRPVSSISSLFSAAQESSSGAGSNNAAGPDPLVELRRASLDVLGALKEMELRYRLPVPTSPTTEGGADEQPPPESPVTEGGPPLHLPPSDRASLLSRSQRGVGSVDSYSEISSDGGGDGDAAAASSTTRGHLYRSDVTLADLRAEKDIVRAYVEKVDEVIFASFRGRRGGGGRRGRSSNVRSVIGGGGGGDGQGKHEGELVVVVGEEDEEEVVDPRRSRRHLVPSTPTPKQRTSSLANVPTAAAAATATATTTTTMSGAIGGASDSSEGEDTEEEEGALPDWAKEGLFDGEDAQLRKSLSLTPTLSLFFGG